MEGSSGERGAAGWSLGHSRSLISAPLPPAPREIMFPWGMKKHPFVQALIAMLLCQVNEWQAGTAAGHSQCQAAKPAALGQPGPAGLGALPTSAPRYPPLGTLHWDSGAEGSAERERGAFGGGERGGPLGGSLPLSEAYSFHPPFPFPSLLFFRLSASIRPLIRRKWL